MAMTATIDWHRPWLVPLLPQLSDLTQLPFAAGSDCRVDWRIALDAALYDDIILNPFMWIKFIGQERIELGVKKEELELVVRRWEDHLKMSVKKRMTFLMIRNHKILIRN